VIRYPKDKIQDSPSARPSGKFQIPNRKLELGKAEILKEGNDFVIIALGSMVMPSFEAIEILEKQGLSGALINARFIRPLDVNLFASLGKKVKYIFTAEEGILEGGFGSAVAETLEKPVIRIGLPCEFIPHGRRDILLEKYGLNAKAIADKIKSIYA
jgi:1-deoxy-D-xylulose-5-phosphate synthase